METRTIFTPSAGSVAVTLPGTGGTAPMPPVDMGNTATLITNNGGSRVLLNFGDSAPVSARADMPGLTSVDAGQTILLPANHPAGAATFVGAIASSYGAININLVRGSTATQIAF